MTSTYVSSLLATCLLLGACASGTSSGLSSESEALPAQDLPGDAGEAAAAAADADAPAVVKAEIQTLEFRIEIGVPVETVWERMFSLEGYRQWTAPFMAGSYFEGSWAQGERMHFLAPGGSGMVAVISENRPHEVMSIEHIGYVMGGVEDTSSAGVQTWAPAYETYRFARTSGGTEVTVEHDVLVGFEGYMNNAWPKALAALKELCETE
ncbi:MAG: SRPBCC domain-containing protein [Planctomycetota bacterium]